MTADRAPAPAAMVVVLGGNAVVGQALELLLQGSDCAARFLAEPSWEALGSLGAPPQLVLLAPGLDVGRREALLALLESVPATAEVPVLELAEGEEEARDGSASGCLPSFLPWPCGVEDLKRQVRYALLARAGEGWGGDASEAGC